MAPSIKSGATLYRSVILSLISLANNLFFSDLFLLNYGKCQIFPQLTGHPNPGISRRGTLSKNKYLCLLVSKKNATIVWLIYFHQYFTDSQAVPLPPSLGIPPPDVNGSAHPSWAPESFLEKGKTAFPLWALIAILSPYDMFSNRDGGRHHRHIITIIIIICLW